MSKRKKKDKKSKSIQDPYFNREAEKYPNPIPSREYILEYLRERGLPARRAEIIEALGLAKDEDQEALRRRLRAMERDGQIVFTRRGGYGLVEKMDLIRGRVIGHKDGFGFVAPEDGGPDLYLNAYQMRAVFDGDRVLVRVAFVDRRGRREAELVEVLERNSDVLVGRYFVEQGIGIVVPENQRISQDLLIPQGAEGKAEIGQYVMAEITTPPTSRTQAIARVVEILGEHMAPGMEIDVAIRSYGLPHRWPQALLDEIASFKEEVNEADKQGRVDLTQKPFVTIDGEDARDFDDAVLCERKKSGFVLYVAIADVAHYVKPGTALDKEAYERGNSVYFPARVIPMLPEILSNGLCSLKPNVDRLAMVCEMQISKEGKINAFKFYEAVIHSHARMTYTNVAKILVQKNKTLIKQYKSLITQFEDLFELYKILAKRRAVRGALDFDTVETKVIYGNNRKIENIVPTERNEAHRLIEECMLAANVSTANLFLAEELPALYRVHEGPSTDKLADLHKFLSELGLRMRGSKNPTPKDYASLLDEIQERPEKHLIQTVLLRSLCQAVYSPKNEGHFGLAYDAYTHFTSPIRRYPDLIVHRAIRYLIAKQKTNYKLSEEQLADIGDHCSMTERRADQATRDVMDWLKCEYMQDRVGEEFDGIITGVTAFGLFIELKDIFVEGLLHITALENDYFHFDATKYRLIGERTRQSYRLGDPMRVKLVRVDLDARKMDFEMVKRKRVKKSS